MWKKRYRIDENTHPYYKKLTIKCDLDLEHTQKTAVLSKSAKCI